MKKISNGGNVDETLGSDRGINIFLRHWPHARAACASGTSRGGWVSLFDGSTPDGSTLDGWDAIGDANWRIEDGAIVADKGGGFLVSKGSYTDFQIRAEFWASDDINSGIFIRCTNPSEVSSKTSYEANIFDQRPQPEYGTGAFTNLAKVNPMPKAGGKWNLFEIIAKGPKLTLILNGQKTVDGVEDSRFPSGRIALQHEKGAVNDMGTIKFRKVDIKPL
jgi:hypothetical protein